MNNCIGLNREIRLESLFINQMVCFAKKTEISICFCVILFRYKPVTIG